MTVDSPPPAPSDRAFWRALWPLLLPLLFALPSLGGFSYPGVEAQFSDIAISHYPNLLYIQRALTEFHALPFWSPTILSGYPFAAEPMAGLWYPPGWLALLLPLPLGVNLTVMLHLLWGGLGFYLLLRAEKRSHRAALLGALAFTGMPKIFAHFGAGHLTLLFALPWTPWLLLSARDDAEAETALRHPLAAGLILGLIFLAGPQWAAYAALLYLVYGFVNHRFQISRFKSPLFNLITAAFVSAPLLLPLVEYTRLSTRASLTAADVLTHSLPPVRLLGLIFPDWGGPHEWMLYPGAAVLVLGLVAVVDGKSRARSRFWMAVALISLLYALGDAIPGLASLAELPGFSLLRVPSRMLFAAGMAFAALAAHGLDGLLDMPRTSSGSGRSKINLALTGLLAFTILLAGMMLVFAPAFPWNAVWGAAMVILASLGVWSILQGWLPAKSGAALLIGLVILDGWAINRSLLDFRSPETVLAEGGESAAFLADHPGDFRVYSPSYSLPQQTAAFYRLELADGVEPLQLATYADFMAAATGVPRAGYSVTMPPYANGDPAADNAAYRPDPALLGLLNVRFVAAEFDLPVEGLRPRARFGETRLYENELARPRAWMQPLDGGLDAPWRAAEVVARGPNRIVVQAEGPGLLVLSEITYPGWLAAVDGESTPLRTAFGILRAVSVADGEHRVEFIYRPWSVYLGLALGLAGWALAWILGRRLAAR